MKAAIRERYGGPAEIHLSDYDVPAPDDNEVLIEVHASSINKADYYDLSSPFLIRLIGGGGFRKPKDVRLGTDVSGVVKSVGAKVTRFKPGDEVFGVAPGSYAEYAVSKEHRLSLKPESVPFEDAGAVPVAAVTALQGLRKGDLQAGQKVMVAGASGGVGTFAVQLAKSMGADLTAVCSTRNLENARTLGADRVIDYSKGDFVNEGDTYDLILGVNGYHSLLSFRRALKPRGAYVLVGSSKPLSSLLETVTIGKLATRSNGKKLGFMGVAKIIPEDLDFLAQLMASGKMKPLIDGRYPLDKTAEAFRYFAEGHARGKVVITVP